MRIKFLSFVFLTLTVESYLTSADRSVECRPEKISNAIHKMSKVSSHRVSKCRKINSALESILESDCPGD